MHTARQAMHDWPDMASQVAVVCLICLLRHCSTVRLMVAGDQVLACHKSQCQSQYAGCFGGWRMSLM